jgi:hypothetical protein
MHLTNKWPIRMVHLPRPQKKLDRLAQPIGIHQSYIPDVRVFFRLEDRYGNGVSIDIAQSVGGPSDEALAGRPNLGELLKANLAESNPRYDMGNFAAEYMSVKLSDDKRRGLRIRDFGISSRNTFESIPIAVWTHSPAHLSRV